MIRILSLTMMVLIVPTAAWADSKVTAGPASLEDQLKELDQGNSAPAAVSRDKLYAVQTRYLPLTYKSEFTLGGGYNLTGDSFLTTYQFEVGYRFHFSDRWAVGLSQAWVDNEFKSETANLRTVDGAVPNVPYTVRRSDMTLEYNVFYGKFRVSSETVFYFDQYLALGAGLIGQNTGTVPAGVGDVGFAFWLQNWGSLRLGLKDYVYNETYQSGTQLENNLHVHLDAGYVF